MSRTIVLSVGGKSRTLTLDSISSNGTATFTEKAGPLVGRLQLQSRIRPNAAGTVLRASLKLSESQVSSDTAVVGDGLPKVQYVQVWSHDISIVVTSSVEKRTSLADLTAALVATKEVRDMVINGADPAI